MRYLSIDIESTGLNATDFMIEFAAVPFDTKSKSIETQLSHQWKIKCPSWEQLLPSLNPWVIEHNENMIKEAHLKGVALLKFKEEFTFILKSKEYQDFFGKEKIILFGKSMNAIDLPFMNRDLGWDWMREHFCHRVVDFSSVTYSAMDMGLLPTGCESGSFLMNYLGLGLVAHHAMEDAVNTAKMYFELLERYENLIPKEPQ